MRTVNTVQEAINAVNAGATAVYRDIYKDQMRPSYRVLETEQEAAEFQRLVQQVEEAESGTFQVSAALDELEKFVGSRCLPRFLKVLYKDGWLRDPENLLEEEEMRHLQEEDAAWFDAQREHFAGEGTIPSVDVHCGICGFRATVERVLLSNVEADHSTWCTGTLST